MFGIAAANKQGVVVKDELQLMDCLQKAFIPFLFPDFFKGSPAQLFFVGLSPKKGVMAKFEIRHQSSVEK